MIKFGPSGNSAEFYDLGFKKTEEAFPWIKEKGLTVFEYSFGKGVRLTDEKMASLKLCAEESGVELSVHAPYYINLANPSEEMIEKSFGYLTNSLIALLKMGGNRVVFHPGSQGKMTREEAFSRIKANTERFLEKVKDIKDGIFCPETMGKINQMGNLDEIVELCTLSERLTPCIDFGHLNARDHGSLKTEDDYLRILDKITDTLGERGKKIHIHFSKIEWSKGGEVRHLTFEDQEFGPHFQPLATALVKRDFCPIVLSESNGTQAKDAKYMLETYNTAKQNLV